MLIQVEDLQFDRLGRLMYNPFYHTSHRKPFTESELEYLCKFYETDGAKSISMALGKTETTVATKVLSLRKRGLFDYYKNLNKHW